MQLIITLVLTILSPVWPLGHNPLPGEPAIIVNKQTNELAYVNEGSVKEIIRVATGKEDSLTPEGEFTVTVKAENPYYRRKDIPGGSPDNPLGTRWIGFDARETDGRIYGIHGTNRPDSIGEFVSDGCIRMRNEEIEQLFKKVPLGTKVFIVKTDASFNAIAIEKKIIIE